MAGLYIHIPFCESRCAYCDFYSTTSSSRTAAFLEALKREMALRHSFLTDGRLCRNVSSTERRPSPQAGEASCEGDNADGGFFLPTKLDTIYMGGGTPSLLSPGQLQGLLDHAAELWDCSALREVTLEANPEDLTDGYLSQLTGFNRLSIGIQSFDDGLLLKMNRRHSATRAKSAVQAAQKAGFDNISIDLIYGIPGMTSAQWEQTLDEAVALGVQHVSAYHLTIEPGTAFGKMALRDEGNISPTAFRPIPEAESERQYETLRRRLGEAGFEHYEISNWTLPERRALHNSAYWSGEPYLGVGPSAHSFDGERRREWIATNLDEYITAFGNKTLAHPTSIYGGETLSDKELFNERVMTALRTAEGLDTDFLESRFGPRRAAKLAQRAGKFLAEGLLVIRDRRIAVPPEKFLLSDYIIGELFEEGN